MRGQCLIANSRRHFSLLLRLSRAVGKAKAKEMILTGRVIDADEAERIGLIARVAP
ncbi:enoyl-CoA hydratase-related protein [Paenarthrobacter aromaticivorans]|uniref:enoyl-CoA hydratase-related protein n=1 Tax=Paenarthrobacter aromaticivorans TaxID=2849150 RepID=UPI003A8095F5